MDELKFSDSDEFKSLSNAKEISKVDLLKLFKVCKNTLNSFYKAIKNSDFYKGQR
ncbi:MAG: hypothetical protein SPI03_03600 [Campylobacter sputorum]|uniref:hypothetical protein n=1 Tax=Campylobacter sputorum TaxID=206 RepID=UPI0013747F76|nr:hypothetical protein [Campylobacter sputorum]ASM38501.1 hypothetical protein CSPARA_0931 [Campylobacter sputorum bv. paraureolyticus LMG 11764]MDY6120410.1 hypothetical protein [Campylobacter sputorum]